MTSIICKHCKIPFDVLGNKTTRLYCSRQCSAENRKTYKDRTCPICFNQFYPSYPLQKTCGTICGNKHQRVKKLSVECKICKNHFTQYPSNLKHHNRKYCSVSCRDLDPDVKLRLLKQNRSQGLNSPNKLETLGYKILKELNLEFIPQYIINNKFTVDAFIPSKNIIIQFDGDYWHGNPTKFPKLNSIQQKRKNYDKSQDAYMVKCGYTVLRFWETDLKKNAFIIKQSLLKYTMT